MGAISTLFIKDGLEPSKSDSNSDVLPITPLDNIFILLFISQPQVPLGSPC